MKLEVKYYKSQTNRSTLKYGQELITILSQGKLQKVFWGFFYGVKPETTVNGI